MTDQSSNVASQEPFVGNVTDGRKQIIDRSRLLSGHTGNSVPKSIETKTSQKSKKRASKIVLTPKENK